MKYYVGIDQGGTKSDVIIGDEDGKIIDRYIDVGYSNILADNKKKTYNKLFKKCVEQQLNYLNIILDKNHIKSTDIFALVASSALANNDELMVNYRKQLHDSIRTANIVVCNDMICARRAGTDTYPSGVIGMGTGTGVVFFYNEEKPVFLTQKITKQANKELGFRAFFHACYSALQMLEPTLLSDYVCKFAGTDSVLDAFNKADKCQDISALPYQNFVPYIYEAYLKNDNVSQAFIHEVALNISDCIRSGINEMNLSNTPFTLVLNGGAFKGNGYIMENLLKSYLADLTDITIIQAEYEPVYGALLLAYEKFGDCIPPIKNAYEFNLNRMEK